MESLEACFDSDRALVIGIGGGGDVVGAVPTARLLETHGVDTHLGGLTWERPAVDPRPGPRSLDELSAVERLNDAVGLATGATTTAGGVVPAEARVAAHYGEQVVVVDPSGGARGLRAALDDACTRLGADLVVGTDSGGDALASGEEPGIESPLADALGVRALAGLETDACLGVFGYGSDGELSRAELDAGIGRAARRGGLLGAWGLTPRVVAELDALVASVPTEASRLPLEAARGETGERAIRGGERAASLSPASAVTFYLDPAAVAATSEPATLVAGTESLDAADAALRDAGYGTELADERPRESEDEGRDD